ncbi:tetratricopeptide repeat protein [Amycolatopsis sp. RTGN1]|uniref:tetratricopeptide repeat protein n=1 Tax=Amycolatopsis ponsaeliensis TaxID=2992142 RepID=UPI00254ABE4B|nr:tetratricopeptide repeat protein [Amycolatopsis sp. RTGN1]
MSLVHGHLPEPAQRVYELLADHPGPDTTATPLADALDLTEPTVTAALQLLHTAHLIQRRSGQRYALADRFRQHATHLRGRLPLSVRNTQRARLIDWYAATAAATVPLLAPDAHRFSPPVAHDAVPHTHTDDHAARTWFGGEHRVLRAVLTTALDWHWDNVAVELAEAIWHLARPTYHHDDLVHAQQAGHTAAHRAHPGIAAVFGAREAAGLADLGRHDDALAAIADATSLAHDTGDSRVLALALSLSGRVRLAAGHPDDALHEFTLALRHQRRLADDHHGHAVLHRRIGQAYLARGRVHDAVRHLRDSSEEMTRTGHPLGAARAATYLAEALIATRRPGVALAELGRARRRIRDIAALRYHVGLDLAAARAAYHLGDTGITHRLTDNLIHQLTHAGPGAAADLHAATHLRDQVAAPPSGSAADHHDHMRGPSPPRTGRT